MKINVIITGSTGMVGEGVLHECILLQDVNKILVINRRPCGVTNTKLTEVIHDNFFDLSPIENQLSGYDACFYCLGVTSLKMKESEYYNYTYSLTLNIAQRLARINPKMIFCYISGAGTDSPEKAKFMRARVKGKTENDLFNLPFYKVYSFRPGLLKPTRGLKNVHKFYYPFSILYPIFRLAIPKYVSTLKELAHAMIICASKGYEKQILEVPDIIKLSKL